MNKKSLILLGVLAVLIAGYFIVRRSIKSTLKEDTEFAVKDIERIDKIFISKNNNKGNALLTKQENGTWRINNKYDASPSQVEEFLQVIKKVEVKSPVSKAGRNEVIRNIRFQGVKVDIYQDGNIAKTYYVGGSTPDLLGTLMYMKGAEDPYICYMPGLNGFLTTYYSTNENDWRNPAIFALKSEQIAGIRLDWKETPQHSFEISNQGAAPSIKPLNGQALSNINMNFVRSYLNMWENLAYDGFPINLNEHQIDSISKTPPYLVITATDKAGKVTKLDIHHKGVQVDTYTKFDEMGNPIKYEPDNFYAFVNDNTKEVMQIQDFVFGKVMKFYQDFAVQKNP